MLRSRFASCAAVALVLAACSGRTSGTASGAPPPSDTPVWQVNGDPTGDGRTCSWWNTEAYAKAGFDSAKESPAPNLVGQTFPSLDGCSVCTCTVQGITCGASSCPDAGTTAPSAPRPPGDCPYSGDYTEYCPDGTIARPSLPDCRIHCPPTTCEKLSAYMATVPVGVSVACEKDGDCESVPFATGCLDRCTTVIAKLAHAEYESRLAELKDSSTCKAFKALACKVEVPPCDPPAPPQCVDKLCQ